MNLFVRQLRRQKTLRKMANMRAAKARKRLENPVEREPRMVRWFPIELGLRDKRTQQIAWVDFKSVRDAAKRLAIVQRFYQ